MADKNGKSLVFGLDIGTRSIVGSVGYLESNKFNVIAHYVKEHDTRAMIDGQIHDIEKVAETIKHVRNELENMTGTELTDVCIAAAGRVLKTITVRADLLRDDNGGITSDEVYNMEMLGIEKAYDVIRNDDPDVEYYCVGYSVIKSYLNDYIINVLEGHRGKKISADILVTFLPNDVVDGLYRAVSLAGLSVANLTLEPIAAINIAIPEQFRLLNIALLDVGAGTSDISITKDGSIIAYGMIPHAGDEITEAIARKCLVDFTAAEKIKLASMKNKTVSYKDIMKITHKLTQAEARELYDDTVDHITKEISDKIIELNGGKSVSAVFVVGGGGKANNFIEYLSKHLDLPKERVALRGHEVLGDVIFADPSVKKDPLLVTPIGICLNYYAKHNNFIFVNINNERIKLYDNDKLTVVDAAIQIGFPNEGLFPKRGKEIKYTVNGVEKMIRGEIGEPAVITINGQEADMNSKIIKNDVIIIKESTAGKDASITVDDIAECKSKLTFNINGNVVLCPKHASINGSPCDFGQKIEDGDEIEVLTYYTVSELLKFMDIDYSTVDVTVNTAPANENTKIYEQFTVNVKPKSFTQDKTEVYEGTDDEDDTLEEIQAEVPLKEESKPAPVQEKPISKPADNSSEIVIIVNKQPVILKGKKSYIFVDILDFYPFNTSVPGGTDLKKTINGIPCDFTSPIKDSDIIELYWI